MLSHVTWRNKNSGFLHTSNTHPQTQTQTQTPAVSDGTKVYTMKPMSLFRRPSPKYAPPKRAVPTLWKKK
jgi:hypothetical protein